MNGWILAATLLLGTGLTAALWGVATGPPRRRVVAQNLSTALACPGLLLLAQGYDRPSYVDLALALALLGPVGTLVLRVATGPGRATAKLLLTGQSGHVGDYVAWLLVGTTLLGAPALPGILGS
ncbi:monovalent cation/H+ antiporter complex subunit F [Streptomyces sp. NPDC006355]|uniref:monovalent cation/H+ antiporter complex subunit F n=1 Tax=Streptomyces sp. NPDC006355 TaxID=3156758 RepID=UPI0033B40426